MYCTKCGAQLKETQKFCVKCGEKITAKPGPQRPAPATQPPTSATAPSQTAKPAASAPPIQPPAPPRPPAEPPTQRREVVSGLGTVEKRSLLWLWIGAAAILLLGAGGYFGYRHWHGRTAPRQVSVPPPPHTVQLPPTKRLGAEHGTSEESAQPNVSAKVPAQPKGAVSTSIRNADFLNFSYPSDCWKNWNAFLKDVPVSKGHWSKPVSWSPTVSYFFSVQKIEYADIGPGGELAAAVHTSCGGPANFQYNEVFVFADSAHGPKLLSHLTPSVWGAGQEDNGGLFQVTGLKTGPGKLEISFYAGGSHAEPQWVDTAAFQWQGDKLVRTGLTRQPFAVTQTAKTRQGLSQPEGAPDKTTNTGVAPQANWGFSNPLPKDNAEVDKPGPGTTNNAPPHVVPAPPPPALRPVRPPIASEGTVVWSGHLDKNSPITIQGSSASSGTLEGQLPGVPVMIQVSPPNIAVAEFPGPQNGWKKVVLRGSKSQNVVVRIKWKSLQQ